MRVIFILNKKNPDFFRKHFRIFSAKFVVPKNYIKAILDSNLLSVRQKYVTIRVSNKPNYNAISPFILPILNLPKNKKILNLGKMTEIHEK